MIKNEDVSFKVKGPGGTVLDLSYLLVSVYDVDAVAGLNQLSVPVPTTRDVAWVNLTVQLDGLTQHRCHVLQVLIHLQWFH